MRASHLTVIYPHPFSLSGYPHELPAGQYEVLVEEETVTVRGVPVFRWTAAYLTLPRTKGEAGRRKRRPLNGADLVTAMQNRLPPVSTNSAAGLSPQEYLR